MQCAVCLEMLYGDLAFDEKVRRAAEHGFCGFEFWGWRDKNLPDLSQVLSETGSRITNFSGHRRGSPVSVEDRHIFLRDVADAAQTAVELSCPTLMILSNELGEGGRVVDAFSHLPAGEKHANMVQSLKRALDLIPREITAVIEPLNTVLDHPGNYLSGMEEAVNIVAEVGDPRLQILADFYHLEMMGERTQEVVSRYGESIGYVHIADVPGRHEPGTGTIDWKAALRALRDSGYDGTVGFEYEPAEDSDRSLDRIAEVWTQALRTAAPPRADDSPGVPTS